jgi:hypothetical protein
VRDPRAEPDVLLRVAEEVDDLRELVLRLVDPRHVGEGDPDPRRLVAAGARAAERPEHALDVAGAPHEQHE